MRFALQHDVDYIAQSFVRSAQNVRDLKQYIRRIRRDGYDTPVVAKIEKPEALDDLEAILDVADGVMVARGDLGVEMNLEGVPNAQRDIVMRANERRIPVITATQMLQSMIETHGPPAPRSPMWLLPLSRAVVPSCFQARPVSDATPVKRWR